MKKLLLLCMMMSLAGCFSVPQEEKAKSQEETEKTKPKYSVDIGEGGTTDFSASGTVVDEKGEPVNDVRLTVTKTFYGFMNKQKDKNDSKKINGTFDIRASGIDKLTLTFLKKEYYPEKIQLTRDSPNSEKGFTSTLKDDAVTANDIKIVMRAKGIPAKMVGLEKNIPYYSNGSGSVMNLDTYNLEAVKDMSDVKSFPENCIYVCPELTADKKIAKKVLESGDTVFTKVTFKVNDPEGGFIVFPNKGGLKTYQYMKEAPETGYQKELSFDFTTSKDEIYFYFKSKGKYGKGRVGHVYFECTDDKNNIRRIEPRINFLYNPDGSRNVNKDQ